MSVLLSILVGFPLENLLSSPQKCSAASGSTGAVFFEDTYLPDPPPEKSREESELDYTVDRIEDELKFAGLDEDCGYHGSTALALLSDQVRERKVLTISRQQATRLRSRLQLVVDALLPFFPEAEQKHVLAGLKAAESLVAWWALSKGQRKGQSPDAMRRYRLRARWLQNALHNVSILEELEDTAVARRGKIISTLKGSSE